MENMFSQIDQYIKTNQKKIFSGKLADLKFSYKSIVREPKKPSVIEDPKTKKKGEKDQEPMIKEKCKFWKAKLDLTYPEGLIQTSVYIKNPNGNEKPEKKIVTTVTELEQYLTWASKVRFIVMMNKLWAEKNPKDEDTEVRKYGLTFKIALFTVSLALCTL